MIEDTASLTPVTKVLTFSMTVALMDSKFSLTYIIPAIRAATPIPIKSPIPISGKFAMINAPAAAISPPTKTAAETISPGKAAKNPKAAVPIAIAVLAIPAINEPALSAKVFAPETNPTAASPTALPIF